MIIIIIIIMMMMIIIKVISMVLFGDFASLYSGRKKLYDYIRIMKDLANTCLIFLKST